MGFTNQDEGMYDTKLNVI